MIRTGKAVMLVLAVGACGGGEGACGDGDLDCVIGGLKAASYGGFFREFTTVVEVGATGEANAPTLDDDPYPPLVLEANGSVQLFEVGWRSPTEWIPGFCLKICDGDACSDARCEAAPGTDGWPAGLWASAFSIERSLATAAALELEITPVGTADGTEPVALLAAGDVDAVLAGAPRRAQLTLLPEGDGGSGGVVGCPSAYDGEWSGLLGYEVATGADPLVTEDRELEIEFEAECLAVVDGTASLQITWAWAGDPVFGCGDEGCVPTTGVLLLPAEYPTSASNVAQAGHGWLILFPNGSQLAGPTDRGDGDGVGELVIDEELVIEANSGDPSIDGDTWQAYDAEGNCWPEDTAATCTLSGSGFATSYYHWVLGKVDGAP